MPQKQAKPASSPESSNWKRALETGMQFTEMRRSQARDVARDLVAQGVLAREQVSSAVDDIVEISRRRADSLRKLVSQEVSRQMGALGLATKDDVAALERRLRPGASEQPAPKKSEAKKSEAKKSAPKKSAPKKSEAKKSEAKKSEAKKSGVKKSGVKKTGVKKTGAKKSGAKKSTRKAG